MAKRTLSTLLVLALLMGMALAMPVMAVETGENLVANGDFETDANADGKADGWTAPADKYVSEGSNTYLSVPQKADYMYNRIPVEPGKTYKVSVDYKNTNAEGVWIYLYQYKEDLSKAEKEQTASAAGVFASTGGEWASYTFFAAPAGDDVAWWAPTLRSTVADDASLAFDNLSIVEVDAEEAEIMYSGDMEKGTVTAKEGVIRPGGVAVSAATEGASVALESNLANVRSGAASLKMINNSAEDSVTAVIVASKSVFGESNGDDGTWYYIEGYFKADQAIDGTGVSCTIAGGSVTSSSTNFTAATNGWQKLITTFRTKVPIYDFKVTLKLEGAGTVYWDDFSIHLHETFVNGDFAGRWASTTAPSVWSHANCGLDMLTEEQMAQDTYIGLVYDEAGKYYYLADKKIRCESNSLGTKNSLKQSLYHMEMGATYRLEFDFVDGDDTLSAVKIYAGQTLNTSGTAPDYSGENTTLHCNNYPVSNTWHHAELYIIPSCNVAGRNVIHWAMNLIANTGTTKIKDIKMEKVTEQIGLKVEEKDFAETVENGQTVTAWYTRPETYANYVAGSFVKRTVITSLYKVDGENLILEEVYIDAVADPYEVKRVDKSPSRTDGPRWGNQETNGTDNPAGHVPSLNARNITIPAEGEYVVKTFAWDNTGAMTPSIKAATAVTATN